MQGGWLGPGEVLFELLEPKKTERMEKLKEHAWGRVISNVMEHAFSPLSDIVLGFSNLPLLLLPSAGP